MDWSVHRVVCYIEVGAAGNYYSTSDEGIPITYFSQLLAAGEFGTKVAGYPEYYLNIQSSATVSIIKSMIKQQRATNHCGRRILRRCRFPRAQPRARLVYQEPRRHRRH